MEKKKIYIQYDLVDIKLRQTSNLKAGRKLSKTQIKSTSYQGSHIDRFLNLFNERIYPMFALIVIVFYLSLKHFSPK